MRIPSSMSVWRVLSGLYRLYTTKIDWQEFISSPDTPPFLVRRAAEVGQISWHKKERGEKGKKLNCYCTLFPLVQITVYTFRHSCFCKPLKYVLTHAS